MIDVNLLENHLDIFQNNFLLYKYYIRLKKQQEKFLPQILMSLIPRAYPKLLLQSTDYQKTSSVIHKQLR